MVTDEQVQEMAGAFRHYTACGVIVHPLATPVLGDHTTGKTPKFGGYNVRKEPYPESDMLPLIKKGCNLGIVCGKASDITVIDIDWYNPAIADYLFHGLDRSKWLYQSRQGKENTGHIIFKYVPALSLYNGTHQVLGFDILSQNIEGKSLNCVCTPSMHYTGQNYRMTGDISDRPEMPALLVERLIRILELYAEIKIVLLNCRATFRRFWEAMFVDISSGIYHQSNTMFRKDIENRIRCLGMFTEMKANGATTEQLLLCCRMAFGEDFKERHCLKEFSTLDTSKPWTNERIQRDEYLSQFYTGSSFDPFTEPLEKLEAKLSPESRDAYETLMCEAPCEALDLVRRAFLVGVFTKHGYVKKEDFTQVEAINNPGPEMKTVWKHEEKYTAPVVNMDSAREVTVDPELLAAFNKAFE